MPEDIVLSIPKSDPEIAERIEASPDFHAVSLAEQVAVLSFC